MSRMVSDREKLTERVLRAAGSALEALRERLAEIYAELPADEEAPEDPVAHLKRDLRLLKHRTLRLRELHEAYGRSRIERRGLWRRRDRLAAQLHSRLAGLRKIVDGEFGTGGSAALLGITGRTRRKHEPLLAQTREVLLHTETVRDKPVLAREFGVDVGSFDVGDWRARLVPVFRELAEVAQFAVPAEQMVVQARADRDRAVVAVDVARRHAVNTAVSYCKLAGLPALAERIRRFSRQRDRPGPKKGWKEDTDGD